MGISLSGAPTAAVILGCALAARARAIDISALGFAFGHLRQTTEIDMHVSSRKGLYPAACLPACLPARDVQRPGPIDYHVCNPSIRNHATVLMIVFACVASKIKQPSIRWDRSLRKLGGHIVCPHDLASPNRPVIASIGLQIVIDRPARIVDFKVTLSAIYKQPVAMISITPSDCLCASDMDVNYICVWRVVN